MRPARIWLTALAVAAMLAGFGPQALAQIPRAAILAATTPAPAAAPAPAPAPTGALAPAQARAALDVLKDDAQRARLISVLEAIARVQPVVAPNAAGSAPAVVAVPVPVGAEAAAPAASVVPAALQLAPDSVGAQLLVGASAQISTLSDRVVNIAREVTDFPLLWYWLTELASDPQMQKAIFDAVWRLVVVLGVGLAAGALTQRLLRRLLRVFRERAPASLEERSDEVEGIAEAEAGQTEWMRRRGDAMAFMRRLPYALGSFGLDLLPVVAVAAASYGVMASGLAGGLTPRLVILAVLYAYLIWRVLIALATAIASPAAPRLRLIPVDNDQARVIVRETTILSAVAVAGTALAEMALLFGLYQDAYDALLKLNALVVLFLVVRIIMRNRRAVKLALCAPPGSTGMMAGVRNGFAGSWHRIVIFYMLALWLVWALQIDNGFSRLLQLLVSAVAVTVGARLVVVAAEAGLNRLRLNVADLEDRYPGIEARLSGYHPMLRALVNFIVGAAALVLVLEVWGFDAFAWFSADALGGRLLGACGTILATLVLALAAWEGMNALIAHHLATLARSAQLARTARIRTLLPIIRTTMLVTVCLVAGMVTLSEIGVNIAPLLAGAGVIGIAIGFGSQKLVQDIITGIFLLLENAMQVGDVVTLGGMSGTVENLSIRTIRLRAIDGAVHIVPFSAVTTVTNSTRDYGFAVFDLNVGVNEEPDRITAVLKEIAAKMRTESPWRGLILADLEVMGVERFLATVWVMRVRIKTLPASRWSVSREMNRRIKIRFDELAIESPMTSYRALSIATPLAPPANQDQVEIS
jgi:small-conductance mechanosensitive channel